jgi:TonB family protein
MSEKYINNDDEDEITYRTTDFLTNPDIQADTYKPRRSGGILIFFVLLSLLSLVLCAYIYFSKNNNIKNLNKSILFLKSSSQRANADYSFKIKSLEDELKQATETIGSLSSKGKEYNESLNKTQSNLAKIESEKKNLLSTLEELNTKMFETESALKNREQELNKTKSERKKAEDDLRGSGEKIANLESEIANAKKDASFWQKKYEKLSKEQTDAVNDILTSAKQRQKSYDQMEQELLKAYEKTELYYSLIGWEENYKLTNRVPLSKLSQKPVLLTTSRPIYPESALKNKIEGMVILKGVLTEEGRLSNLELLYSPQGSAAIAEAAKAAAVNYRYKPAMKDGQFVKVVLVIPMEFQLSNNTE